MKYYYTRKEVSDWLKENKILNHEEIDRVLLGVKNEKWKPCKNERYYYVTSWGQASETTHDSLMIDKWNIKIGNCFKTKKEAEAYKQKLIDLGKKIK